MEQLLEQRELAYAQKVKLFESKIIVLKEQLDAERKRRLEMVERSAMAVDREDSRPFRSDLDDSISALHHRPRERHLSAGARIRSQSLARSSFRI